MLMNNLNSVLLEGNLVRDPELKTTPKCTSVSSMTVISNRYYKKESSIEREVGFFGVEAWGKLAELVSKRGKKGCGVRVVGRLKQDRWVGSDGKNRSKITIVAEHIEFRPEFKDVLDESSDPVVPEDDEESILEVEEESSVV